MFGTRLELTFHIVSVRVQRDKNSTLVINLYECTRSRSCHTSLENARLVLAGLHFLGVVDAIQIGRAHV